MSYKSPPLKPAKTFADYAGAALSPLLIMLMVGSFVFFLVDLFYGGEFVNRVRWTMFWFVFAMVLVSRISIEESFDKASIYGGLLAAATAFWLFRFVNFFGGVLACLALIWWTTSKLVWDCSVVKEDEDASGEGLMGVANFDDGSTLKSKVTRAVIPWWKRIFKNISEKEGSPHAPGLWVVYFSVVALPLFGIGYAFLPAGSQKREQCFTYVWVFVIAALGLLLTSSFLGLRRYLRQRYLQMPGAMTFKWFQSGFFLIALILLGALLLPRPEGSFKVNGFLSSIGSPARNASSKSFWNSDGTQRGEKGFENDPGDSGKEKADNEGQEADRQQKSKVEKGEQNSPDPASYKSAPKTQWLKLLIWILMLAAVLFILIKYWKLIVDFIKSILRDFQGLRLKAAQKKASEKKIIPIPPRPFSSYLNPFLQANAPAGDPSELLRETFEALEAWSRESGLPREKYATPIEFGNRLIEKNPHMADSLTATTLSYSELAYGQTPPPHDILNSLEALWDLMTPIATSAPHPSRRL
jgi:hypothetical protein